MGRRDSEAFGSLSAPRESSVMSARFICELQTFMRVCIMNTVYRRFQPRVIHFTPRFAYEES